MPYGIGLAKKGISEESAFSILDTAWHEGIRCLDTARAYGVAEGRIGKWLANRAPTPRPVIISKFPALTEGAPLSSIDQAIDQSRKQLGTNQIDLYLAHRGADLLRPGIAERLHKFVDSGKIEAFGASIYDLVDARALLKVPRLGALQVPLHLANTAAADCGLIEEAATRGVAVFARSVFLQGLLVTDPRQLTGSFSRASPILNCLENVARDAKTTRLALSIAVVRSFSSVSTIVVGADSVAQLTEILAACRERVDDCTIRAALEIGRRLPHDLADPRRWKKLLE